MIWKRALLAWVVIVVAESIHGTIRELFLSPVLGDLPARQFGVLIGSGIIFLIAVSLIRWIGANTLHEQLKVGALWVVLIVVFEVSLGLGLGYPAERLIADYNPTAGGFMGFGLLFMLFAPAIAFRVRALGMGAAILIGAAFALAVVAVLIVLS